MLRKISDEELLEKLRENLKKLPSDARKMQIPQYQTLAERFGSVNEAICLSGADVSRFKFIKNGKYSISIAEKLIDDLKKFYEKNSMIPRVKDFENHNDYYKYFFSWNAALVIAGIKEMPVTDNVKNRKTIKHVETYYSRLSS